MPQPSSPLAVHSTSKLGSGAADAVGLLGEAGWLYRRIQAYIAHVKDEEEEFRTHDQPTVGAIQRGLTAALVQEMNAYRTLLVELERQQQTLASVRAGERRRLIRWAHNGSSKSDAIR